MAYPFAPNPTWGELIAVLKKRRQASICVLPNIQLQHQQTGEVVECRYLHAPGYTPYGLDKECRAGAPVSWTVLKSIGMHFELEPGEDFGLTAGWPGPLSDP